MVIESCFLPQVFVASNHAQILIAVGATVTSWFNMIDVCFAGPTYPPFADSQVDQAVRLVESDTMRSSIAQRIGFLDSAALRGSCNTARTDSLRFWKVAIRAPAESIYIMCRLRNLLNVADLFRTTRSASRTWSAASATFPTLRSVATVPMSSVRTSIATSEAIAVVARPSDSPFSYAGLSSHSSAPTTWRERCAQHLCARRCGWRVPLRRAVRGLGLCGLRGCLRGFRGLSWRSETGVVWCRCRSEEIPHRLRGRNLCANCFADSPKLGF